MKCLICDRIELIKKGENPYFVTELATGYVVIGDHQLFNGYTLFLAKEHVSELHRMASSSIHLLEMAIVAEAVYKAFQPDKLNYELLGNTDAHVHWHIIPRYKNDPAWGKPIWTLSEEERAVPCSHGELEEKKRLLKRSLKV